MQPKTIGIIAGAGPFAGHDLVGKILSQTLAARDQDHLPILSLYRPAELPDRTEFLMGRTSQNPGLIIAAQAAELAAAGAAVAAIPCNTAHAPVIFAAIEAELRRLGVTLTFLHLIDAAVAHLRQHYSDIRRVGILSTTGTYEAGIYPARLTPAGYTPLVPSRDVQVNCVHPAIYDPAAGIKATGQLTPWAAAELTTALVDLREQGAEAVILGCTELPLAASGLSAFGLPFVDPTLALARALIAAAAPARLRPF